MVQVLALFLIGAVEYALAAAWTESVSRKHATACAGISFVNVMIWGTVVTYVSTGGLPALIAHALGCAVGAWLTVRYSSK